MPVAQKGVVSYLPGIYEWRGQFVDELATGEGELLVFEERGWATKRPTHYLRVFMARGEAEGWVEIYDYINAEYWFGPTSKLKPLGCGLSFRLSTEGHRVESTYRLTRKTESGLFEICTSKELLLISEKAGVKFGKSIIDCLASRKFGCMKAK